MLSITGSLIPIVIFNFVLTASNFNFIKKKKVKTKKRNNGRNTTENEVVSKICKDESC